MGTEVLRPQDLLAQRFHAPPAPFHRRRNYHGNMTNLIVNRRSNNNTAYRKTSPKSDKKKFSDNAGTKKVTHGGGGDTRRKEGGGGGGPAMGQVTILRRGESLDSFTTKINGGNTNLKPPKQKPVDDLAVLGTGRIGPDSPKMLPKQIRLSPPPQSGHVYAGSAFSLSPSPRSLPLPSFFNKKQQDDSKINSFDDPATRDLRRLLRLD